MRAPHTAERSEATPTQAAGKVASGPGCIPNPTVH